MPRLFISHSSQDNVAAKAFKQWLGSNGWPDEDVFLDVDDINAGERWKEALRNANFRCEAVILLASPEALGSPECLAEIRKAEDYGKEIIVVLLRDLKLSDQRLGAYKERQIVELAAAPLNHTEAVEFRGAQYDVQFNGTALARIKDYLIQRGITPDHFAWPPLGRPDADPFPGLGAFSEDDAGIFFGRDADILRGLDKLRITRRNGRPRTFAIQAASGAGKSSFLRAGVWPRLERDPDFAPVAIIRPAQGVLTGPNGLGRKLAARLSRPDRQLNPGDINRQLMAADPAEAAGNLRRLMAEVTARAFDQRRVGDPNARPPALVLAIDQAEELFAPEDAEESERLIVLLTDLLSNPPEGVEPFAIFAVRADSAVRLFQLLIDRGLEVPETLPLLPLPRTSYRDIILKPLEVLARRGQKLSITPELVERLVDDSAGADALPLLAFTLSNLYADFGAAGTIGIEQYEAIGGVSGCIDLALKRALAGPGNAPVIPAGKEAQLECLRATFIPWLARINPENGLSMRRPARRDEFSGDALAMVERLVQARLLLADQRGGADVVEIAHESLLRQWHALTGWLETDAENLKIVEGVERAAGEWARTPGRREDRLEHRSRRLRAAERIAERADFRKRLGPEGLAYLAACRTSERRRTLAFGSTVGGLLFLLVVGTLGWLYEPQLADMLFRLTNVHSLDASAEAALKPAEQFAECTGCPMMVTLPAGGFDMGARPNEGDSTNREYPQHHVTIAAMFAVAETPVTFAQFITCAEHGECDPEIGSSTNDDRPATNVTWNDARQYAAWLARITGKPYRLLSEAEYEYAERAGSPTKYPWGEKVDKTRANCGECDTGQAPRGTTPVTAFPANGFGLYDMDGNVFEWVADCFHANYSDPNLPVNGAVWDDDNCLRRVVRGASWLAKAALLRSSWRDWREVDARKSDVGFRVARALAQ